MLRSVVARVIFLIAIASPVLAGLQSARAEMSFEAWLTVAVDSLDQQIGQQSELPWKTLDNLRQRAQENFDRMLDQCRMGFGGTRGLQLVRVVDLLVELRDVGVAGTLSPAKNWNFPLENYELRGKRIVQSNARLRRVPVFADLKEPVSQTAGAFLVVLDQCRSGQRLFQTATARLATQANKQIDRLRQEVCRPAQPLVQAVGQAWEKWHVTPTDQNRAGVAICHRETVAENSASANLDAFKGASIKRYWLEVCNFAQAKLNWFTSKARHIAEACLKSIEPQFLTLELDPLA